MSMYKEPVKANKDGGARKDDVYYVVSEEKQYTDGLTKQGFKDSTDINKIFAKAANGQTISHLAKYEGVYGDFSDIGDLLESNERLQKGMTIFQELPSEVRNEFKNDAGAFFKFVNDPANVNRLAEVLPHLAKPGDQMPDIGGAQRRQEAAQAADTPPAGAEAPAGGDAPVTT